MDPKTLVELSREVVCNPFANFESLNDYLIENVGSPLAEHLLRGLSNDAFDFDSLIFAGVLNYVCPPEKTPSHLSKQVRYFSHFMLLYYFVVDIEYDINGEKIDPFCSLSIYRFGEESPFFGKEIQLSGKKSFILEILLEDISNILMACECRAAILEIEEEKGEEEEEEKCDCLSWHVEDYITLYGNGLWTAKWPEYAEYKAL
jgi:hypothetical protein